MVTKKTGNPPGRPVELVPSFIQFRNQFWKRGEGFWYQQDAFNAINKHNRLLLLLPPGHTKTMTFAIEHSAWRLMRDKDYRITNLQKNEVEAKKVIAAVQMRLADHEFYSETLGIPIEEDPITLFGPFKPEKRYRESSPWGANYFMVQGSKSGEKDYSMQAKGAGSALLSVRSDLIILDDIQDPKNKSPQYVEDMMEWIQQVIISRLYDHQKLIILGSRIGPNDIYSKIMSSEAFEDWPVIKYPAILPACVRCMKKGLECGHEERNRLLCPDKKLWTYQGLMRKKKESGPSWHTTWMQEEGGYEEQVFKKEALEAARDEDYSFDQRFPQVTHVVLGCDPAISAYCGIIVWGLDARTGQRYLLDIFNEKGLRTFDNVQARCYDLALQHGVQVAAIEMNNVQGSISNDPVFVKKMRGIGCRITTYQTRTSFGARAETDDFDISTIGGLFDSGLITLPYGDERTRRKVDALIAQFLEWRPGVKYLTRDMVMATLFAESEARLIYQRVQNTSHLSRPNRAPSWAKGPGGGWKWRKKKELGPEVGPDGRIAISANQNEFAVPP